MIRKILLIGAVLVLGGCSHFEAWENLTEGQQNTIVIATTIAAGAILIAEQDHSHTVNNCISTRSLETGCPR